MKRQFGTVLASMAVACMAVASAAPALAHDDDEHKEKARRIGLAVGKAYACSEGAEKAKLKSDSEDLYDTVLFDAGHEVAYIYAVGVGFGAAKQDPAADCAKLQAHVDSLMKQIGVRGAN